MINPINWKDNVVEHPDRFVETDLGGGYTRIVKAPGETVQPGTPMNAANFNDMDKKAIQGIVGMLLMAQHVHQQDQKIEGLEGQQIQVTMTNTQKYPFNNSKKTVQISPSRNTKDYSVEVEVLSKTGSGGVGEIEISDKLVNGFKIAYPGGAASVTVNCIIRGGI